MNQILAQEIIIWKFGLVWHIIYITIKKPEQSGNKDDCYITRVEEDGKDENTKLVEPLNQFEILPPRKFKYVSEYVQ